MTQRIHGVALGKLGRAETTDEHASYQSTMLLHAIQYRIQR